MKKLLAVAALALAVVGAALMAPQSVSPVPEAQAATNAPLSAGVMTFPFHITGTTSATTTKSVNFNMPQKCQLVGAGASARTTSGTMTVDVLNGAASIMSSPIAFSLSGVYTEGTIGTPAIADEAAISVTLTPSGGTPTFSDITVLLTCVRN